jgi:glycosyltransferase involved in cell wall biosynthesis
MNLSRATIISVSELNKTTLINLGIEDQKIHVLRNGVNKNIFHSNYSKYQLRKKFGLSQKDIIICYVGRNTVLKGNLELREMVQRIDAKYIIIGPGFEDFSTRVIYNGVCMSSVVAEYMAISDIFFFPTHHEGSPNALIEAISIGLPVVCTDLPELREICDVRNTIFVNKGDLVGFQSALNLLISNEGLRISMSDYSQLEMDHLFDIEMRINLLVRIFSTGKF